MENLAYSALALELEAWVAKSGASWPNQTIQEWSEVFPREDSTDVYHFVSIHAHGRTDLDTTTIVGQRDHYAGQSWLTAITRPKDDVHKMRRNLERYGENPDYYFSAERKDMSFNSVDGRHWYSAGLGNHRTVIAKFAHAVTARRNHTNPTLRNVGFSRYTVDWESLRAYQQLKACADRYQLPLWVAVNRISLGAVTFGSTTQEWTEPVFFVQDERYPGICRHSHLSPNEFRTFARWTVGSEGRVGVRGRLHGAWQAAFGDLPHGLVYPGASSRQYDSMDEYAAQRVRAWQASFAVGP